MKKINLTELTQMSIVQYIEEFSKESLDSPHEQAIKFAEAFPQIFEELQTMYQVDSINAIYIIESIINTKDISLHEINPINTNATVPLIHLFKK